MRDPRTWELWCFVSPTDADRLVANGLSATMSADVVGDCLRVTVTEAPPKAQKVATRKHPATRRKGTKP